MTRIIELQATFPVFFFFFCGFICSDLWLRMKQIFKLRCVWIEIDVAVWLCSFLLTLLFLRWWWQCVLPHTCWNNITPVVTLVWQEVGVQGQDKSRVLVGGNLCFVYTFGYTLYESSDWVGRDISEYHSKSSKYSSHDMLLADQDPCWWGHGDFTSVSFPTKDLREGTQQHLNGSKLRRRIYI